MNDSLQFDVVIAGGGMVGLSMALALAETGLHIALVDQSVPTSMDETDLHIAAARFDSRVSALTPATVDFLQQLGVWESIQARRVCPYQHMQVWDADGTGVIDFHADEIHASCLGYIVENRLISAVLAQAVSGCANIQCFYGQPLTGLQAEGNRQLVSLADGQQLATTLLIGADGGRSRIREWAGFATRAWSYEQQAMVATVRTALPHHSTALQRFMATGPLAFLPLYLPGAEVQHYSSIVWSCDPGLAEELGALSDTAFARRCTVAIEAKLGAVELQSPVQSFGLQQLHAVDYVQQGIALVGDAAHTIHPLAGQGVNLGFADVLSLSEVIHDAWGKGKDFASLPVLSAYQRDRKPANLGMMASMEGFKRLFGSDELMVRWLRNTGLNIANGLSPVKHLLMRQAMGLK